MQKLETTFPLLSFFSPCLSLGLSSLRSLSEQHGFCGCSERDGGVQLLQVQPELINYSLKASLSLGMLQQTITEFYWRDFTFYTLTLCCREEFISVDEDVGVHQSIPLIIIMLQIGGIYFI